MGEQAHRRLVAILAADIVGFSRLMEDDEKATLSSVRHLHRDIFDPLIDNHGGRMVKLMGDGAIAEFASVVDAVNCAIAIQATLSAQQAAVAANQRVVLRIGINLGDVVAEDGDLLGDGVNVAARLEQLCKPGAVLISGTVFDQLQGKVAVPIDYAGEHRVKNISRPVRTYTLRLSGSGRPWRLRMRPHLKWGIALTAAVAILAIGWAFWAERRPDDMRTIAVLPFNDLDGNERWERLASGLSEDIITDLARHPEIFVIARNSSFAYKDKSPDVRQVGRELGVRYVLEGSVQARGDFLRVTAQLIDTATGTHVWAERYDRSPDDLFAVQDEITGRVVGSIASPRYGEIAKDSRAVARRKPPSSLDAYDLYLLGTDRFQLGTRDDVQAGIDYLEKAVALDPQFARAWSELGIAYSVVGTLGYSSDADGAMRTFRQDTLHALEIDPNDWVALGQRATLRAADGDLKGAGEDFERTISLAPNDADNLALMAYNMPLVVGDAERSVALAERAMSLNPSAPSWYSAALSIAQYVAGNDQAAIEAALKAPVHGESLMIRAMASARLGKTEEARALAQRIRTEFPDFTVDSYMRNWPVSSKEAIAAFRYGATKAGLVSGDGSTAAVR
ncbi:adenylate/guanylate cyclase domain-containing protein [Rhizobium viscosum]|uniref:TolB-like protein/class 3 adenylate cyclase/Flp pilus assembly protein TadD n=1 Tax=Rhizobium viscosum TaxID=1673 RepID=A0ABR9J057_RHIVS|nr:adenylate/guanylate cyclase domain-containing protein [Rhizobium viscosum]MBE1508720.1 TolB-like protein/class 3 adenylate cyclase/Flp pilus assembly protein TadD [Rhizobium viscosum]